MSLFKGRTDVYAKRWESKSKDTSGYSPVCLNQWRPGICSKPRIPCSQCEYKSYAPLDAPAVEKHLRENIVVGELGGGKNSLSGIVDIAVMPSLSRQGEVKACVQNYGMIIADELMKSIED